MANLLAAVVVCCLSVLAYLYLQDIISSDRLTPIEQEQWVNFTNWLEENGVPKMKLKLAHFDHSGRGVVTTSSIQENEDVIVIPFNVMMSSYRMEDTHLGKLIRSKNIQLSDDVFLSICLLYEKLRGDSFWKPYIDLLPSDFSNLPLFFSEEEKQHLDGPIVYIMQNQEKHLQDAILVAQQVEETNTKYKGIADKRGLMWAISAVRSRMWTINELPGRTLVPLADMLNHHPDKGVALDIKPEKETGTIKSKHYYPAGAEFFDKYYLDKLDSDSLYLMTFGFLMNQNDVTTYMVDYNYYSQVRHENIKKILEERQCGIERDVLRESDRELPIHLVHCFIVLALDDFHDDNINEFNYATYVTNQVKIKAKQKVEKFLDDELKLYTKDNEQEILLTPNLTQNMKNILLVRKSEKKVLRNAKSLLLKSFK